jgi:transcriptional regulator with XRE-family HTH domain
METFGERLQHLLNKKSLKQKDLQTLLNKTGRNTINQWIHNRAKPQADDLAKISELLEVSIDWLLGTKAYPTPEEKSTVTIAMEDYVEYLSLKNEKLKQENQSLKENNNPLPDTPELTKK